MNGGGVDTVISFLRLQNVFASHPKSTHLDPNASLAQYSVSNGAQLYTWEVGSKVPPLQ